MRALRRWLLGAALGAVWVGHLALPAFAAAQPERPAIEARTRAAEISVTIDRRLSDDPALAADLLAEGRRFAAASRATANRGYKTTHDWFTDGRRYIFQRVYGFGSLVAGRYVSIVRTDLIYTGGAHPNTFIDTILWDRNRKKRVGMRPFFKESADNGPTMIALARLVREAVVAEKIRRRAESGRDKNQRTTKPIQPMAQDNEVNAAVQPSLSKLGAISLAPSTERGKSSGLMFHFSPYDVDAYVFGRYTVFVLWTDLRPFLSPTGLAIFGGERPAADKGTLSKPAIKHQTVGWAF